MALVENKARRLAVREYHIVNEVNILPRFGEIGVTTAGAFNKPFDVWNYFLRLDE